MKIVWGEESLRWFHNAAEYTDYNEKLAEMLLKYIPHRGTLCDIGCGAGMIDLVLAPYFEQITCVDISPEVIQSLQKDVEQRGITNIQPVCVSGNEVKGQWDTVMALFHGGPHVLDTYLPMAKDQLILVTHSHAVGGFGPKDHKVKKCFDAQIFQRQLDEMGVKYELECASLEYGQPLTDRQDAEKFVLAYTTPMSQEKLEAYLDEHLQETGDAKYPYYLPHKKNLGMFVIRREDNENI